MNFATNRFNLKEGMMNSMLSINLKKTVIATVVISMLGLSGCELGNNTSKSNDTVNVQATPNSFSSGVGTPTANDGADGSFYIDSTNYMLYGPKKDGKWPAVGIALKNETGAVGKTILSGTGAPSNSFGQAGDFYLDTATAVLYGPRGETEWPAMGVALQDNTTVVDVVAQSKAATTSRTSTSTPTTTTSGTTSGTSTGTRGASVLTGNGAPAANLGAVGDSYIDVQNGVLYPAKTAAGWAATGTSLVGRQGVQGVRGSAVLNGTGAPQTATGLDGDFYIDTAASRYYGPKTSGAWPSTGIAMIGAQGVQGVAGANGTNGTNGSIIYSAIGAPAANVGAVNDYYIDTTTSVFYGPKTATGWPATGMSLRGATGANGTNGSNGTNGNTILNGTGVPLNSIGANNDFYIDTQNARLYGPKTAGTWSSAFISLVGPQGATGAAGAAGAAGSVVFSGSTAPSAAQGKDGDVYIQTGAGLLFTKASGSWGTGVAIGGGGASSGPTLMVRASANSVCNVQLANVTTPPNPTLATCFGNIATNVGISYNPTTGVFTAPTAGIYLVSIQTNSTTQASILPYIDVNNDFTSNTSNTDAVIGPDFLGGFATSTNGLITGANVRGFLTTQVYLTAGQVFSIRFQTNTANSSIPANNTTNGSTNFTITKLF